MPRRSIVSDGSSRETVDAFKFERENTKPDERTLTDPKSSSKGTRMDREGCGKSRLAVLSALAWRVRER